MPDDELLQACLGHLEELPFIARIDTDRVNEHAGRPATRRADVLFDLRFVDGTTTIAVAAIKRTNLTAALVAGIRAQLDQFPEHMPFVMAPHVTAGVGRHLAEMRLNYVDVAGNLNVRVDDKYVAAVGGKKPTPTPRTHGLRAAAYQVIFVLLTHGREITATMRQIAADANVALGTVKNTLDHLRATGAVDRVGKTYVLRDRQHLIDQWVLGYETTVRPRWLLGRFTTQTREPQELEALVRKTVAGEQELQWAWGGGTAAFALTKYYRGPETVLHLTRALPDLPRRLRALPDERGNLVLLRTPAGVFLDGKAPHTAHPLVVYAELRTQHDERADETAEMIRTEFIRD